MDSEDKERKVHLGPDYSLLHKSWSIKRGRSLCNRCGVSGLTVLLFGQRVELGRIEFPMFRFAASNNVVIGFIANQNRPHIPRGRHAGRDEVGLVRFIRPIPHEGHKGIGDDVGISQLNIVLLQYEYGLGVVIALPSGQLWKLIVDCLLYTRGARFFHVFKNVS